MKHPFSNPIVLALSMLMVTGSAMAAEEAAHPKMTKTAAPVKVKRNVKQVDINAASKAELMKLPGIKAADADRIIAGRPYGSKAWLVTNNIIPEMVFLKIKHQIVARQHQPIVKPPAGSAKPAKSK